MIENILQPIQHIINEIILAIPGIIVALVILLLGWIIAKLISGLVRTLLKKVIRLQKRIRDLGLQNALGRANLSNILAKIVYWWIFLIFIGQAAAQVDLGTISELLTQLITWLPHLIYALFLILGGVLVAEFVSKQIASLKAPWTNGCAKIVKIIILVVISLTAAAQIGLDVNLVNDLVKIFVGSLGLGFALAIGIAFGLGMKDDTRRWAAQIRKFFKS